MPAPVPRRQIFLVLGAMFAFSLMAIFTRGAQAPFLTISAWRAIFVAAVFGVWAAAAEGGVAALRPDRPTLRIGGLLGLALALASSTFVGGYAFTTVANTIFLHNLAPVIVFPLAWWTAREKPSPAALTGTAIALFGVAMLSGVSVLQLSHFANPRFIIGDVLALMSAVGYGGVLVATRAARVAQTPIIGTLFVAWTTAAVVLCAIAGLAGQLALPMAAWPWVLGLAVICTNVPFYLLNLGMRSVGAGLAAVLSLSEVVFATLLGMLAFGEELSSLGWIGGALAAAGVVYAVATPDTPPAAEQAQLPAAAHRRRALRVALALGLLNVGALSALLVGANSGLLLAWIALVALLRLGLPLALASLDGHLRPLLSGATGVGAAVALAGLVLRGGWSGGEGDLLVGLLALAAAFIDQRLAHTDPAPLLRLALVLLGVGQLAALGGHPGGAVLAPIGAAAVALVAVRLVIAELRGQLSTTPPHRTPDLAAPAAALARLAQPRPLLLLLGGAAALGGIRAIPTGHVGVVERLGFPLPDLAEPGLHVRWPPPVEQLTIIDRARSRSLRVADTDTPLLCGDHALISARATLHWTVGDAPDFAFSAEDPTSALARLARAALVVAVGQRPQDDVLTTGRAEIEAQVAELTQQRADGLALGVNVEGVQLVASAVPPPVTAAFLDVINAGEDRQTAINQAEAYAADLIPRSRGEALGVLSRSEGEAARLTAQAEGEVGRIDQIRDGSARAPGIARERLALENLERALSADQRVLVVSDEIGLWLGGEQVLKLAEVSP